ncbi:CinA family protein, partial [Enterobacter sp. IF2SW-P2]|uniref:CinA family protein n=1 Tax=Enterobacter sp. IF2SW-P2 TaxID=1841144 RepID=UPI00159EF86C
MIDHDLLQLSVIVGLALKLRGATITTAESCTGGWVAKAITDIAGSSAWFE